MYGNVTIEANTNADLRPNGAGVEPHSVRHDTGYDTPSERELGDRLLRVGLVDCYRFSQEALVKAWEGDQWVAILPFATVQDCVAGAPADLDVIVYHTHVAGLSDTNIARDLAVLGRTLRKIPLIVMSEAEDAQQPQTIRRVMKSGVRGFIPTRIMGIPLTLAVMRFIKAGGTYAPLDLFLSDFPELSRQDLAIPPNRRFTSRQISVLSHLKQGKANKTIAHELGMSESTVKVHVRNIMRTMGASNRTEAAFKAQQLWGNPSPSLFCGQEGA